MALASILIGLPEIADIAKVSRPAVSNWRKRYDDFPEPKIQSDSGVLFDLGAVEEWLLSRGKIDRPIPPGTLVWRVAEGIRATWPGDTLFESTSSRLFELTISWLCYLEACSQAADSGTFFNRSNSTAVVSPQHRWTTVRESSDGLLAKRLRAAARSIENANPQLADLLTYLAPDPFPDPALLRSFVAELEAATTDETPRLELFGDAEQRFVEAARSSAESTTPDDLSYLITRLVGRLDPDAVVVDPACGTGGLLLMAAVTECAPGEGGQFVGADINSSAARRARARCFLYGVGAEILMLDSLRREPGDWPAADAVVCDPPYGTSNWGDADLYRSTRWRYGSPPPKSADLAWVELALHMLKPSGRAVVVLPPITCERAGREAEIREALLRDGVIEAVIHLPPRLRRDTSIPLTIWVLGAPRSQAAGDDMRVLLVDGSRLGTPGRSTHDLDEEGIDELARLISSWRDRRAVEPADPIEAVAVDPETLVAAGCVLHPRRHLTDARPVAVEVLRDGWTTARARVERSIDEIRDEFAALAEASAVPSMPAAGSFRVQLGDVAEIFRPRGGVESNGDFIAEAGDVLLTAVPNGFDTRALHPGDRVVGLHPIVIRTHKSSGLTPEWLLTWTRTDAFGSQFSRHARGSTSRSLSIKDLAEFELHVPPSQTQEACVDLLERLNRLEAAEALLRREIDELRAAGLRLTYASALG